LDTGEDSGDIIGWRPSVLQDIETQLASSVDVGMKHCADEFDSRWLVGILFLELHDESEGAVFKGGVGRADDDSVPVRSSVLAINYSVLESDHVMTLSAIGEADTPAGGSVCMR
jgi:hypothetical protein